MSPTNLIWIQNVLIFLMERGPRVESVSEPESNFGH